MSTPVESRGILRSLDHRFGNVGTFAQERFIECFGNLFFASPAAEEEHGVRYDEIVKLKDRTSRPLAVWGCVSVTSTLPHGSVADVKASVERSFHLAGKGRGFVLSSTSSVMPEVPHANIDALFQHGWEFGAEFLAG